MKTTLSIFVVVLLLFTITTTAAAAKNTTAHTKCNSAPLYILFEEYYEGHPFRNVNLERNESHWNITAYEVKYNSMDNYNFRSRVSGGGFSNVFKAYSIADGTKFAFKQMNTFSERAFKKEIQIMKDIADLPNILAIRDILRQETRSGKPTVGLMFDYFRTKDYEQVFPTLTKSEVKYFVYETLRTLHYAHSKGIVHRDIKPLNVLMSPKKMQAKVIDWGQSGYFLPGKRYTTAVSSINYMPPELLLEYGFHDYALDIWSTGCMLAEMTFLKFAFFEAGNYTLFDDNERYTPIFQKRSREQLDTVAKVLGTVKLRQYADKFKEQMDLKQLDGLPEYKKVPFTSFINGQNAHLVDSSVIDLLEKMLTYDHTRRITAAEALMHPYFAEVRDSVFSDSPKISLDKLSRVFTQASR